MVGESKVQPEGYRHLALCYVRLSYARDEAALNSAEPAADQCADAV